MEDVPINRVAALLCPSALNLKPQTLNPEPSTLNPQHQTLNTKHESSQLRMYRSVAWRPFSALQPQTSHFKPPSSLNTQHSTLITQPSTLNTQPSTLNTQHSTLNTQPSTPSEKAVNGGCTDQPRGSPPPRPASLQGTTSPNRVFEPSNLNRASPPSTLNPQTLNPQPSTLNRVQGRSTVGRRWDHQPSRSDQSIDFGRYERLPSGTNLSNRSTNTPLEGSLSRSITALDLSMWSYGDGWWSVHLSSLPPRSANPIMTSIFDAHSGSKRSTTHLDHTNHCKTAVGTNWLNGWSYRVFAINTRRDQICPATGSGAHHKTSVSCGRNPSHFDPRIQTSCLTNVFELLEKCILDPA